METHITVAKQLIQRNKQLIYEILPKLSSRPANIFTSTSETNFPPPPVTFIPFDLDALLYDKDIVKGLDVINHRQFTHRLHFRPEIFDEARIFTWKDQNTGHELNSLRLTLTTCVKFVSESVHGNCKWCYKLKIGIFKKQGNSYGNVIWLSLREAQHIIFYLVEYVSLVEDLMNNNDWDMFNYSLSDWELRQFIDSNQATPSKEIHIVPVDFREKNIVMDFNYQNKKDPEIDIHVFKLNRAKAMHMREMRVGWRTINSILLNAFHPTKNGPFLLELYKCFGARRGDRIFVSVHETQHLIIKLIELITLGVEKHIAGLSPYSI